MAEPTPAAPPLPPDADPALAAFIGCTTESVVLGSGSVTWLPMPPGVPSFLGHPNVSFAPRGDAVVVTARWGLVSLRLRAQVVDGLLDAEVDGRRSFGLRSAIEGWVRDMNTHLVARGRRLASITTDGRTATITKAPAETPPDLR